MCSNGAHNIEHGFPNDLEMHVPQWEFPMFPNMGMCYHQVEHVSRFIGTHFTCMLPHVNTCSQMAHGCQICDMSSPCQQGAINNGTC
jgi:hypothetical protein